MKEDKSKMEEGSDKEEASESPEEEKSEGVKIPEEFQEKVYELLKDCNDKSCLSYIRDCVYQKEEEMRKEEMKKDKKNKVPSEYSLSGAPSM